MKALAAATSVLLALLLIVMCTDGGNAALAHAEGPVVSPKPEYSHPTLQQIEEAASLPAPELTDPTAAEELPHGELGREEAGELLTSVFGPEVEGTSGVYGEVEVERYDSDHEAVVRRPEGEAQKGLLESTLPLRVEDEEGETAPVDLDLEASEGGLQPANPLVEVDIPTILSEGISLPEVGISIKPVESGDEQAASTLEEASAFYPNVAEDTDLTVAPSPVGVETLTQLRTPEAPRSEAFELELGPGQILKEAEGGGAVVVAEGRTEMSVEAPSAIDADGSPVPTTMSTEDDRLTITVEPGEDTVYPILVDPVYDVYAWGQYEGAEPNFAGWTPFQNSNAIYPFKNSNGYWGLAINSWSGPTPVLSQARWDWHVPRWGEAQTPTSFITHAEVGYIDFEAEAERNGWNITSDPFMELYLWDEAAAARGETGFVELWKHYGTEGNKNNTEPAVQLYGRGDTNAKQLSFELVTTSEATQYRHAFVGAASVEISDNDNPMLSGANPSGWVNASPSAALPFSVEDTGLGVYSLTVVEPLASGGSKTIVTRPGGCNGGVEAPCPRVWSSAGGPAANYEPSLMPQGEDQVSLKAVDPISHESKVVYETVKVDHTAPSVSLSGTLTEQAKLGTERGTYEIKVAATDGSASAPQSGVVKITLMSGTKTLATAEQACATKNCPLTHTFTVTEAAIGSGSHTLEAIAQDGAGNRSVSKLPVTYTPDHTAPSIELSGPLATAPKGWISQKSYELEVTATDRGRGVKHLSVTLDGSAVSSKEQACTAGGCPLTISTSLNATTLSGGSHELTLTAEDNAANVSTTHKTLNVDPTGAATVASVAGALKAAEGTGAPTTVGTPKQEAAVVGTSAGLELAAVQGGFEAKNPAIPLQIPSSAAAGLSVTVFNTKLVGACHGGAEEAEEAVQKNELCENTVVGGESYADELTLQPTSSGTSASAMTLENGYATLSTNTQIEQDTLVRPLYEGAIDYQVLRSNHAQPSATWTLGPMEGLHLAAIDARHVEVVDAAGRATLTLVAESATDAIGQIIPTKLEINGSNKLTLSAEVPATAVYPVVTRLAIRGGTLHIEAEGPKTEAELHREEERVEGEVKELEQMQKEGRQASRGPNYHNVYTTLEIGRVSPPVFESGSNDYEYEFSHCNWGNALPESWITGIGPRDEGTEAEKRAWLNTVGNCMKYTEGKKFDDAEILRGKVHFLKGQEVWFTESDKKAEECLKTGVKLEKPAMVHCYVEPEHSKVGVTVGGNYRRPPLGGTSICETFYAHINAEPPYYETFDPKGSYAGALNSSVPEYCKWPTR